MTDEERVERAIEADVKRVAKAICYANCLSRNRADIEGARVQSEHGWDLWILEARAAIVAMQSEGIPVYASRDGTDEVLKVATYRLTPITP